MTGISRNMNNKADHHLIEVKSLGIAANWYVYVNYAM